MISIVWAFISTPLGRYVGIIAFIAFLVASGWVALKVRDAGIRREALENFNRQQLELALKQQEEFNRQTRILQETQARIIDEMNKKIEETDRKTAEVEAYLNSPETRQNDKPASDILKETLRRLGATQ
jgi:hypothetical protein